jgi:catechol 2,3-dioxygenase-like lactoylglutathione lyase family enzyme
MRVDRLDHLVLTVANVEEICAFYSRVYFRDPDGNLIEVSNARPG